MPDRHGFDLFPGYAGDAPMARCIHCRTGGPIWQWPEERRQQHADTQHAPRGASGRNNQRQRDLLAAPLAHPHEEKEATTMAKQTPTKGESAKQVALDILQQAGEPLHAKEIAKRVIDSGRCTSLKGKTPEATIAALLAVGSKPGGPFKRVDKGTYTLADSTAQPEEPPAQEAQQRKPARQERQPQKRDRKRADNSEPAPASA